MTRLRARPKPVVLVDERSAVEAEVVAVRSEESPDIRLARKDSPVLVLERGEIAASDPDRPLDLVELDPRVVPRLAQRLTNPCGHGDIVQCRAPRGARGQPVRPLDRRRRELRI